MRARLSLPLGAGVLAAALVLGVSAPALADQARSIAHKISGTSIAKRSIPANRLKSHAVTAKQIAPLTWHPITNFKNGWQSYGAPERAPAYAVDVQGIVHLRGAIKAGTDIQAFTLPTSILPTGIALNEPVLVGGNGALGFIQIIGGSASILSAAGTPDGVPAVFTSLEGVTWSE